MKVYENSLTIVIDNNDRTQLLLKITLFYKSFLI
jgi:hypothetical protein